MRHILASPQLNPYHIYQASNLKPPHPAQATPPELLVIRHGVMARRAAKSDKQLRTVHNEKILNQEQKVAKKVTKCICTPFFLLTMSNSSRLFRCDAKFRHILFAPLAIARLFLGFRPLVTITQWSGGAKIGENQCGEIYILQLFLLFSKNGILLLIRYIFISSVLKSRQVWPTLHAAKFIFFRKFANIVPSF